MKYVVTKTVVRTEYFEVDSDSQLEAIELVDNQDESAKYIQTVNEHPTFMAEPKEY